MSYHTFTNDDSPVIIEGDKQSGDKQSGNKQCIICLETNTINKNDTVTLINEMHFLIKGCDCICYAHHKCIEKWIATNAVCPICKRIISFPFVALKNKECVIEIPQGQLQVEQGQVEQGQVDQWQAGYMQKCGASYICIRLVSLLFIFLIIQQILIQ